MSTDTPKILPFYKTEDYKKLLTQIEAWHKDFDAKESRRRAKNLLLVMNKYKVNIKYAKDWEELLVRVTSAKSIDEKGSGEAMFNQILDDLGWLKFKRKHFVLDRKKKYLAK